MKAKHLLLATLTATSLAMGSSKALAATFAIDTFDVPEPPTPLSRLTSVGQTDIQTFTDLDPNEVLGGDRKITYTLNQYTGVTRPVSTAEVVTGTGDFDGAFEITNNTGSVSTATLEYIDLGFKDFTELSGSDNGRGIAITQQFDGIFFAYTLMINDGMNMSTVRKEFTNLGSSGLTQVVFTFDDILNSEMNTGVDLSMVNYVKLVVEGEPGYDIAITEIGGYEVPEPSTLLGLLAVLGTGAFSIKRKSKAE